MPAQKICSIQFFSQPSIVHGLNKNIFDIKTCSSYSGTFKDYPFCTLNPNPERHGRGRFEEEYLKSCGLNLVSKSYQSKGLSLYFWFVGSDLRGIFQLQPTVDCNLPFCVSICIIIGRVRWVYTSWQKATNAPVIFALCNMQYMQQCSVFSLIACGSYQQLPVVTSSCQYTQLLVVRYLGRYFIYLPHDYNNYKKMPKKNVGRDGEEA